MTRRRLAGLGLAAATLCAPRAAAASSGSLEIFPDPVLLGVLIVLFLALIVPCQKLLFEPLLRVLDERKARIEGRELQAREIEQDANQVQGRYETQIDGARTRAQQARRDALDAARAEHARLTHQARSAAESEVASGRSAVQQALDSARAQLSDDAEALAREAASQVLGRPLS
jgi:F-type H+-transporting ATPase subunit b